MLDFLSFLREEPIFTFAILLAAILIIPIGTERLRLPGSVGLLAAGILLGPHGANLLDSESQMMELLSDIGLLYLMFVAGLEIDIKQARRVKYRALRFGSLTFLLPLTTGIIIGRFFAFDWNSSVLIGSLLASHSLMTYPIIQRLGVVTNEAVTVTLAGTIFTDIGALIVLAICLGIGTGEFTLIKLSILLASLIVYTLVVLLGFDRLGREFLRRSGNDEGNQFLFLLLAVFLSALGAELIGVEKIVGAFLAGLAVNDAVGNSPVKEKVVFVGSVLFIPIFFVDIGLILDVPAFFQSLLSLGFAVCIIAGLILSKLAAAWVTKLLYRYQWREMLTMWSMSIPQVATTLAATLVGERAGLLTEEVLNSVVVMMLVTATLGPVLVSRFAPKLPLPQPNLDAAEPLLAVKPTANESPFTVVVPVYNPKTERYLIELAALLARREGGQIVPLAIAIANPHPNLDPQHLDATVRQSEQLLATAIALSQDLNVRANPVFRVDDRVAQGITRAAIEQKANLIVMGWSSRSGIKARLFGNIIDNVLWSSRCPVIVARLLMSPPNIRRLLVPIARFSHASVPKLYLARAIAETNQAAIVLLHICPSRASQEQKAAIRAEMAALLAQWSPPVAVEIAIVPSDAQAQAIATESQDFDLVILRSQQTQLSSGASLAASDITGQVLQYITCSAIVVGEPR
jgi:Kef-type K+ transport system membrane component KefB/nucleotide-binding universal stress UspA family protein